MKEPYKSSDDRVAKAVSSRRRKWAAALLLFFGLASILYATLKNFDFQFESLTLSNYWAGFQTFPSSFYDFPRNILLFIPFGAGLSAVLKRQRWSAGSIIISVIFTSFCLTLTVETLQFFLPGRTPTLTDLLANTLGGLAGYVSYRVWQERQKVERRLRRAAAVPSIVITAMVGYLLLLILLGFYLQKDTYLSGWQDFYPLLIGNERTGNRYWKGSISELMIWDKALSAQEVFGITGPYGEKTAAGMQPLAYYPLTNDDLVEDEMGNLPDFSWQKGGQLQDKDFMWLQTAQPADYLAQKFQRSSEFSLLLTVHPADFNQGGPARILSYSWDSGLRNFMLGQEKRDLVLRLRSPMSGENGAAPEFVFPKFFNSNRPHKILVTFDGLTASAISQGEGKIHKIEVVPSASLWRKIRADNDDPYSVKTETAWALTAAFYVVIFIPFGFLLSLLMQLTDKKVLRFSIFLLGSLFFPLTLEFVFSFRNGFEPRFMLVFLGGMIMAGTSFALSIAAGQPVRSRRSS